MSAAASIAELVANLADDTAAAIDEGTSDTVLAKALEAFVDGLDELGWIEDVEVEGEVVEKNESAPLTFAAALAARASREQVWQLADDFRDAARSILDADVDAAVKTRLLVQSIDEFSAAIRAAVPAWIAARPSMPTEPAESGKAAGVAKSEPASVVASLRAVMG